MPNIKVFYGLYDGQVCSVNDPENRGRIQCIIPEVTGESPSAWCEPCIPVAYDGGGDFFLPRLKEFVWIMFEQGNPNKPVYLGGWWSENKTPLGKQYQDRKSNERIINFFGTFIKMLKEENKIEIGVNESDPEIVIENGTVRIKGWSPSGGTITDVIVNGSSVVHDNIAEFDVPTKTSDLINDSDFVEDSNYVHTDNNFTDADKNKLSNLVGDKHFVYTQSTPSDTWVVTHNLNKYPSIEVVDSAGTVVVGDYKYTDANTVRLTFGGAFSGKAYFN